MSNILLSSGLKWRWMENYGLRAMLYGGWIGVYEDPRPTYPDFAATGRLLAKVTQDGAVHTPGSYSGGALLLRQPAIGVIVASPSPVNWILTGENSGRATWFRFYGNSVDSFADDPFGDYVRLDGGIAKEISEGEALILENSDIVNGQSRPITDFFLTFSV